MEYYGPPTVGCGFCACDGPCEDIVGVIDAHWQVYVCVHSDEGGLVLPTDLTEKTGWWEDCTAAYAAEAACGGERRPFVRLTSEPYMR